MKKIIGILAVVLLLSCTPEDTTTTQPESTDCLCGKVVESNTFNMINPNGGGVVQFSVVTMKNNCTGVFKQIQRNGTITIGTKICNY